MEKIKRTHVPRVSDTYEIVDFSKGRFPFWDLLHPGVPKPTQAEEDYRMGLHEVDVGWKGTTRGRRLITPNRPMNLPFKKLHPDAVLPYRANEDDAGLDLICIDYRIADRYIQYHTGLATAIPRGYVGLLFPRSSVSDRDLSLANCVGVLDAGYRGEIIFRYRVIHRDSFEEPKIYECGDKVGQLVVVPIPITIPEWAEELPTSDRGEKGFGSSGV